MTKSKPRGYSYNIGRAINAILATNRSLVGDTVQARELILALCDQLGASPGALRSITALIAPTVLCVNCGMSTHARCCAYCGKIHKPARLRNDHCSAKCERLAAHADRQSSAMEQAMEGT